MEDKRHKLNMAVDGGATFLKEATRGEAPTFTANLLLCVLAKFLAEMEQGEFRDVGQAACVPCSSPGCDCMKLRRDLFRVLGRVRADYCFTVNLRQPRCKRFRRLPDKGGN